MTLTRLRFKAALGLAVLVTVGGTMLIAAACSSSKKADATPTTSSAATSTTAASPASDAVGVISAINIVDNAGLHGFDQSIAGGTIPPTALSVVTHLVAVFKLTPWPDALQSQATAMTGVLETYMNGLNADTPDMTTLSTAAHNAHEGYHEFDKDVWNWLYKEADMNVAPPPAAATTTAPAASPSAAATTTTSTAGQ